MDLAKMFATLHVEAVDRQLDIQIDRQIDRYINRQIDIQSRIDTKQIGYVPVYFSLGILDMPNKNLNKCVEDGGDKPLAP